MEEIVKDLYNYLKELTVDEMDTFELADKLHLDHQLIVGAIKSIQTYPKRIKTKEIVSTNIVMTDEGNYIMDNNSHEINLIENLKKSQDCMTEKELMESLGKYGSIGFRQAMANRWIRIEKDEEKKINKVILNKEKVENVKDEVKQLLIDINDGKVSAIDKSLNPLKKRKLINLKKITGYIITKDELFEKGLPKTFTELTSQMMNNGEWESIVFKKLNLDAQGIPPTGGYLHPLMKVRSEIRDIFLELGFTEMKTNNYVESSFWNFDALFQPQQHPARDAHDTFFLTNPENCKSFGNVDNFEKKVKKVHSMGGYGSTGYNYDWERKEAEKNILRTHTTAVSARMLHKLGEELKSTGQFKPAKLFSIDKVFRNESLDATHLAEFHQVEGVVMDKNLTLKHLMGILQLFFHKLGIEQFRFKPAYNPYTEPSMEVFGFHPGLKKWVEIGNSGIFRPEMLAPMGFSSDVQVIAWGLSLERPTMIKYGYNNIRSLMGHKVDLKLIESTPICHMNEGTVK
ncbi:hypothetical protein SNEBB_001807 [Seison nebaliae]|nr:hypothetical protein SNEBB_001807 [Seison nebaliae]